ncbi:hypothetical protein [Microvirga arabica]|uniref:hypothetical protein n=1 Tax=Microvirga arabica TaxID=1128671 RepID=UPI00193951F6|nr:hypothetical protein [Microvirga arabica]MBM1170066.1 hypothetical protein [Microvirga arabica]
MTVDPPCHRPCPCGYLRYFGTRTNDDLGFPLDLNVAISSLLAISASTPSVCPTQHSRMHGQAVERWQRTQALAFCRISAPIIAKQVLSKLNNREGLTMIAQATDNTPPEAFLEYEGVTVYRTFQFDDPSTYPPSSHIFTTSPDGRYASDPFRFDIRSLTVPAASADESGMRAGEKAAIAAVLAQAIDRGMVTPPVNGSASRPVQVHQQAW